MAPAWSLRDFGSTFATRERGTELRQRLLAEHNATGRLVIDFADVTHVSYSFADEFIGKLPEASPDDVALDLINMTDPVGRTVRAARERRLRPVAR